MFRPRLTWPVVVPIICLGALSACGPDAPATTSPSFAGTTIRIIVGFAPGGTYDLHARLVAGYLGRYLPGQPTVTVENMTGAGGALASNYLATAAAPDGLTIGLINETDAPDVAASKLLDRLALLGSPAASTPVIVFSKRSGITSVDDWRRAATPPRIASSGRHAVTFVVPRLVTAILGLPTHVVSGYAGMAESRLALESGEADGVCVTADSIAPLFGSFDAVHVVLRFGSAALPGLSVPDALSLAPDAHARRLLEIGVYDMTPLIRVFAAPRAVPGPRLALLRDALARTWSDARFLAEARTAGLLIAPVGAAEAEQTVRKISASADVLPELLKILRAE